MMRTSLEALIQANRADGEPPLRVPEGPAQQKALEVLKLSIAAESPGAHLSKWNKEHVLIVEVGLPDTGGYRSYRYSTSLHVFFSGDELMVSERYGSKGVPLSGAAELTRLLGAIRERLLEQRRREQKREKIRKLKERSIESQIDALATRLGFAYALEPMQTKVKLIVRLDNQNGLIVDIPYNRIQEVIVDVAPLIEKVRELYRSGVRFKLSSTVHVRSFRGPGQA